MVAIALAELTEEIRNRQAFQIQAKVMPARSLLSEPDAATNSMMIRRSGGVYLYIPGYFPIVVPTLTYISP